MSTAPDVFNKMDIKGSKNISEWIFFLALLSLLVSFTLVVVHVCPPMQTNQQSQRALLLQGTDSLNNATMSIERSQRIAAETDQIGTDIIEELGEQREQLDRTRNRVR